MTTPITMSLHVTADRADKLAKILRALRETDGDTISRSEVVGRAIDHFFLTVCPPQTTFVSATPAPDLAAK